MTTDNTTPSPVPAGQMQKSAECANACQQAEDYGVWPEHSCSPVCVRLATQTLWAIHVAGIDDIYAMPSKEEAQVQADIFNSASVTGAKVVTVIQWPYTPEAHAANMKEFME